MIPRASSCSAGILLCWNRISAELPPSLCHSLVPPHPSLQHTPPGHSCCFAILSKVAKKCSISSLGPRVGFGSLGLATDSTPFRRSSLISARHCSISSFCCSTTRRSSCCWAACCSCACNCCSLACCYCSLSTLCCSLNSCNNAIVVANNSTLPSPPFASNSVSDMTLLVL